VGWSYLDTCVLQQETTEKASIMYVTKDLKMHFIVNVPRNVIKKVNRECDILSNPSSMAFSGGTDAEFTMEAGDILVGDLRGHRLGSCRQPITFLLFWVEYIDYDLGEVHGYVGVSFPGAKDTDTFCPTRSCAPVLSYLPAVSDSGARIVIQGEQFGMLNASDVSVRVGDSATCTNVQLESSNTISCVLSDGSGEMLTVRVCNRFGCGTGYPFSYREIPPTVGLPLENITGNLLEDLSASQYEDDVEFFRKSVWYLDNNETAQLAIPRYIKLISGEDMRFVFRYSDPLLVLADSSELVELDSALLSHMTIWIRMYEAKWIKVEDDVTHQWTYKLEL